MPNYYYIYIKGEQKGPFSIDQLKNEYISSNTLVWHNNMNDWGKAGHIKELEEIINCKPPPIPNTPATKEPGLEQKKETNQSKRLKIEVIAAKEIRTNSKLILFSLILGLLSYPLFFYIDDGFKHRTMTWKWSDYYRAGRTINVSEALTDARKKEREILERESQRLGWRKNPIGSSSRYVSARTFHEERLELIKNGLWGLSKTTFYVAFAILVIGRYFLMIVKWVNHKSRINI